MHFLLGLAALVIGAVIATRRTRPTWFVVLTSVLAGIGALFAILSFTRISDGLGLISLNIIGWLFVGLSIMTMLSAVFVLERRGPRGEERPALIGENPLDGDSDDTDDPPHGMAAHDVRPVAGSAVGTGIAGAAAAGAAAAGTVAEPAGREAAVPEVAARDTVVPDAAPIAGEAERDHGLAPERTAIADEQVVLDDGRIVDGAPGSAVADDVRLLDDRRADGEPPRA